jgi:hypothetical protein
LAGLGYDINYPRIAVKIGAIQKGLKKDGRYTEGRKAA